MKNLEKIGYKDYCVTSCGKVYSRRTNKFLTGWLCVGGYRTVALFDEKGQQRQMKVHRLVATMFIPNDDPTKKIQVNHIDGVKSNNDYTNLEWCTPKHNSQHAWDNGLNRGKNYKSTDSFDFIHNPYEKAEESGHRLEEEKVREICHLIGEGYRDVDVSRITGINRRYINNIRHNSCRLYSEIVSEYNFEFKKEQRLSPETVLNICKELKKGRKVMEVAREFNVDRKSVGNIKNKKTFKDITSSFNFK